MSIVEKIKELLAEGFVTTQEFNYGVITGLFIALCILLMLMFLKIIFRTKSSNGVTMPGKLGDIFISRTAITSAIMSLELDFPAYVIQKVRLYRSHGSRVSIVIQLCYDSKGGCLKHYSEDFQQAVLSRLKEMFGVENIDKVKILLKDNINLNVSAAPKEKQVEKQPEKVSFQFFKNNSPKDSAETVKDKEKETAVQSEAK